MIGAFVALYPLIDARILLFTGMQKKLLMSCSGTWAPLLRQFLRMTVRICMESMDAPS